MNVINWLYPGGKRRYRGVFCPDAAEAVRDDSNFRARKQRMMKKVEREKGKSKYTYTKGDEYIFCGGIGIYMVRRGGCVVI